MPRITVAITQKDKERINTLIGSGNFSTQSEVIRAALRKMRTTR